MKFVFHFTTDMSGSGYGSLVREGSTPEEALMKISSSDTRQRVVAWSHVNGNDLISELRKEAQRVGRLVVNGKILHPGQPDTAPAVMSAADDAMIKRDGPAKSVAATPAPTAPSAKPAPPGLGVLPDVGRQSHQISPTWATAAVRS